MSKHLHEVFGTDKTKSPSEIDKITSAINQEMVDDPTKFMQTLNEMRGSASNLGDGFPAASDLLGGVAEKVLGKANGKCFVGGLDGTLTGMKSFASNAIDALDGISSGNSVNSAGKMADSLNGIISGLADSGQGILNSPAAGLAIDGVTGGIYGRVKSGLNVDAGHVFSGALKGIGTEFTGLLTADPDCMLTGLKQIDSAAKEALGQNELGGIIRSVVNGLENSGAGLFNANLDQAKAGLGEVGAAFGGILEGSTASSLGMICSGAADITSGELTKGAGELGNGLKDLLNGSVGSVLRAVVPGGETVTNALNGGSVDAISKLANGGADLIGGILNADSNQITSGAEKFGSGVLNAMDSGASAALRQLVPPEAVDALRGFINGNLGDGIVKVGDAVADLSKGIVNGDLGSIENAATELGSGLTGVLQSGAEGALRTVLPDGAVNGLKSVLDGSAIKELDKLAGNLSQDISAGAQQLESRASAILNTVVDGAGSATSVAADAVGSAANGVADGLSSATNVAADAVGSAANGVADGLSSAISVAADAVGSAANGVADGLSSATSVAADAVGSAANGVADGLSSATSVAADAVGSAANGVADGLSSAINVAVDAVGSTANGVADGVGSATNVAVDAVGTAANGVVDGLTSTTSAVADTVGSVANSVADTASSIGGFIGGIFSGSSSSSDSE